MRVIVAGDILAVDRGPYLHYAVYVGNGEVIHYSGLGGDFKGKIVIHRAPMSEFLKGSKEYFVLEFADEKPEETTFLEGVKQILRGEGITLMHNLKRERNYHLYSREETVQRAESRLGETEYRLLTKNCEHFAIWCKTGVAESHQVNALLRQLEQILIPE